MGTLIMAKREVVQSLLRSWAGFCCSGFGFFFFSKKLNRLLPSESGMLLLDIYLGEMKTHVYTKTYTHIHHSCIYNSLKVGKETNIHQGTSR